MSRNIPPNENKLKRVIAKTLQPLLRLISKKLYISWQYRYITHHRLNWENPLRYTEKLQVLRLYEYPRHALVIAWSDRYQARQLLQEMGLSEYLIPLVGIYERANEIPWPELPGQFALKCAHASSFNLIVKDKRTLNIVAEMKKIKKWQRTNYGKKTVEPHYSSIKPRIVVETLLLENNQLPLEYKIHVFNGQAKYLYVVTGRGEDIRYSNFYIDWTPFNGAQFNYWKTKETPPLRPENFSEMIAFAEKISANVPFARVDLFNVNGKIYFNEMTFTPAKGTLIFDDDNADYEIGEWLDISKIKRNNRS